MKMVRGLYYILRQLLRGAGAEAGQYTVTIWLDMVIDGMNDTLHLHESSVDRQMPLR